MTIPFKSFSGASSVLVAQDNSSKSTEATTATPRSATPESSTLASNALNNTPNYGSTHDQTIGIDVYKNLNAVPNLKNANLKSPTGGLPAEALQDAYTKLMAINSTANLSPEQKTLLGAFTDAWISQHPEDSIKIKQGETIAIAKKVAAIFKTQIIDNYTHANIGTIDKSNVLGGTAWPDPTRFKAFFDKKMSVAELNKRQQEIGKPTNPLTGLMPTSGLGYASQRAT